MQIADGLVDLDATVRVGGQPVPNAVYYSGFSECDLVLGFDALKSGMLTLDHCDTVITNMTTMNYSVKCLFPVV